MVLSAVRKKAGRQEYLGKNKQLSYSNVKCKVVSETAWRCQRDLWKCKEGRVIK